MTSCLLCNTVTTDTTYTTKHAFSDIELTHSMIDRHHFFYTINIVLRHIFSTYASTSSSLHVAMHAQQHFVNCSFHRIVHTRHTLLNLSLYTIFYLLGPCDSPAIVEKRVMETRRANGRTRGAKFCVYTQYRTAVEDSQHHRQN